jgi:hypothetical protein
LFLEFNDLANVNDDSCELVKIVGCNSSIADNYDPSVNFNDGSCSFLSISDNYSEALDSLVNLNSIIESGVADPIFIELLFGWNMIGFTSNHTKSVEESFVSITTNPDMTVDSPIQLVKNVTGQFWAPEFGVNMLGDLVPGLGYMIYMNESMSDFSFSEN